MIPRLPPGSPGVAGADAPAVIECPPGYRRPTQTWLDRTITISNRSLSLSERSAVGQIHLPVSPATRAPHEYPVGESLSRFLSGWCRPAARGRARGRRALIIPILLFRTCRAFARSVQKLLGASHKPLLGLVGLRLKLFARVGRSCSKNASISLSLGANLLFRTGRCVRHTTGGCGGSSSIHPRSQGTEIRPARMLLQ